MWIIAVFIFVWLLKFPIVCGNIHEKCCKTGQSINGTTTTFHCGIALDRRIGSYFQNNDFFSKNLSGTCIDVYDRNKIAIFSMDDKTRNISLKENYNVNFFPKCCPVGQRYNKTIHSCTPSGIIQNQKKFLNDSSFVKIGLPQCRIISDQFFRSFEDFVRYDDRIVVTKETTIYSGRFCVDATLDGDFVVRTCEENDHICEDIRCIHKCCPDGQSYVNGAHCLNTFKFGVNLRSTNKVQDSDAPFVIIHGIQKPIYPLVGKNYNFSIDNKGIFSVHMNVTHLYFPVSDNKYCMEHTKAGNLNGYIVFTTQSKQELPMKFAITRWIKLVSCFFLFLTIVVYIIVPKMRNLFGKILLSYSVASFLMFFFLGFSQFYHESFNDSVCQIMGFLSVLSMIWSFTWLHIMTIDIWFSFRAPRTMVGPLQKNEMKRLMQYSLYGWGFPVLWILFIVLLSRVKGVAEPIRPYVGVEKCYMEDTDTRPGNYAYIVFVITPLLIQQAINSLLFVKTILYCLRIKAEIEKMRDVRAQKDLNASKKRLILIVKLAVIMGVSFLFETISSIIDFSSTTFTKYIEVIWDSINCLQGVFIFVIFICKKKVYDNICEEIPFLKTRKFSTVSSTATQQISLQQYNGN